MKPVSLLTALAIAAALTGCTVGPDYHTPPTTVPSSFDATEPSTQPATAASTTRPADIADWWKSFDDPELDSLIDRAIAANFDLEIALTRLQESRTAEIVMEGGLAAGT